MKAFQTLCLLSLALSTEAHLANADGDDPYLWLEEIDGIRSMNWVTEQNQRSSTELQSDNRYSDVEKQMRQIILAQDRTPFGAYRHGSIYNFWQDPGHVKGIWRRTSYEAYKKANPDWETLLDIDRLNDVESTNWVYRGANCLAPAYERCLLTLSPGGKDAAVIREFDIRTKDFVPGGFVVPEAKSDIAWVNENTVLIATNFGANTMTKSGYPFILKLWRRGQPLAEAQEVFRGTPDDVGLGVSSDLTTGKKWITISRNLSFFESEVWQWSEENGLQRYPFPTQSQFQGVFQGHALAILRQNWAVGNRVFPNGSLVSWKVGTNASDTELVFEPTPRTSIQSVHWTQEAVYLTILDHVQGKLLRGTHNAEGWHLEGLAFPDHGVIHVQSADPQSDLTLIQFEDFITPPTLYELNVAAGPDGSVPKILKQEPRRFNSDGLIITQQEALSRDGTRVPYFVIRKNGIAMDSSHPTLLYGYGGFEVSQTPFYLSTWGKVWLEQGGVVAIANIRGGGEFGPAWHQAAMKEKRQNAFDDFIATSEDLILSGVTSPRHLAIMGGSNGGLLVGSVFVQRPDLFQAVVCQVPLLDMLRYHHLLAGASWMEEYGNPDDPVMRQVIEKYSPYQNLKKDAHYPHVLFTTSTRDDRVHPGHARKMAAKMQEYGHVFRYFENVNGGHGGAADLEEKIRVNSLTFTFLFQELFK